MPEEIAYKSIIMRCDKVQENAFREVPHGYVIEHYRSGMESVWAEIQQAAGEFQHETQEGTIEYFYRAFGRNENLLKQRMVFLKDVNTSEYVGVCAAWFSQKNGQEIPIIHWLAVIPTYRGRGCARMLITAVMKMFSREYPGQMIYLHTQPSSYQAIKLYQDFGFCMAKKDCYGTAENEYEEAMIILETVMKKDVFTQMQRQAVD